MTHYSFPPATLDVPAPPVEEPPAPPRPRLRGLRFPALPSGPLLAQLGGAVAALAGVYMTWGTGVALIVGGVAGAALGALREAGKV